MQHRGSSGGGGSGGGSSNNETMSRLESNVRTSFKVGKLNLVDLAGSER